jgi:hypothetical protein
MAPKVQKAGRERGEEKDPKETLEEGRMEIKNDLTFLPF